MALEDDQLARITAAEADMDTHEAARHARYKAEDEQTAAVRQKEDELHSEGIKARDDMKASLEAAIAKRKLEEQTMDPENIAALMARIAHLEATQKAALEAAPAPAPEPPKAA